MLPTVVSERFSGIWPISGSMRNGRCFRRQLWELRTVARGSGSWPTATAADSRSSGGALTGGGTTLTDRAVRLWPTPVARDDQKSPEAHLAMKRRMAGGPRHQPTSLTVVAKLWPTPTAADGTRGSDPQRSVDPMSPETIRANGPSLTQRAGSWPTPQARDHKGAFNGRRRLGGRDLPSEATLPVSFPSGHPRQMTATPGDAPSTPVVLNPAFVEWLMGFPPGWSVCTPLAMEWWAWWLEAHSLLLHAALGSSR